ncbi:hypothetical protein BYT27DRAFT_7195352 [Phlegmacium glaucopus]|nr:hypothetical protein BYT27DRAFT_7195352 [Phlegmacium glaucopus]
MPPKPSFRVNLSAKQQENVPLQPPTMTSFALPGTLADRKLQRKSQQELSFNSFHIQKTRLSAWDLNASPPNQSSTMITYGMPPTPQTPLSSLEMGQMEAEAYVERVNSVAWEDTFLS